MLKGDHVSNRTKLFHRINRHEVSIEVQFPKEARVSEKKARLSLGNGRRKNFRVYIRMCACVCPYG